MNNFIKRAVTGLSLALLATYILWKFANGLVFLSSVIIVLGWWEWFRFAKIEQSYLKWVNGIWVTGALVLFGLAANEKISLAYEGGWLALVLPINALCVLFDGKEKQPLDKLARVLLYYSYVFIPLSAFIYLCFDHQYGSWEYDWRYPVGMLYLIWFTDSFAYIGGSLMGKHKLFERVSPNKTWEGSLTGFVACILLGWACNTYMEVQWNWFVVAVICGIFSQLGDLIESMFKRSLSVKDSGVIFPGHGGILDRFDGFFVVMPMLLAYKIILMLV